MDAGAFLSIEDISVGYGPTTVLDGLNLAIGKGEFVALLGSSGCGKTTLLRTIAGFARPVKGAIRVADRNVTHLPPDKRGMALVFQSYALWPHMTVTQNMAYGLKLQGRGRQEITSRIGELQGLLGLSGLGDRKPAQLSGGQRQRVALGRALAIDPEILLLDEPLSNLDARIRLTVRHEIRALQKRLGITAVHVTHDREEAMVMADRIVVMNRGRIEQQGTPEDVYNRPASPFVAAFMGAENLVDMEVSVGPQRLDLAGQQVLAMPHHRDLRSGRAEIRFRSEAATLLRPGGSPPAQAGGLELAGGLQLAGTVANVSYPGGHFRHGVRVGEREILVDSPSPFNQDEQVRVYVPSSALFIFNISTDGENDRHTEAISN